MNSNLIDIAALTDSELNTLLGYTEITDEEKAAAFADAPVVELTEADLIAWAASRYAAEGARVEADDLAAELRRDILSSFHN
jgi:hypothetical protein